MTAETIRLHVSIHHRCQNRRNGTTEQRIVRTGASLRRVDILPPSPRPLSKTCASKPSFASSDAVTKPETAKYQHQDGKQDKPRKRSWSYFIKMIPTKNTIPGQLSSTGQENRRVLIPFATPTYNITGTSNIHNYSLTRRICSSIYCFPKGYSVTKSPGLVVFNDFCMHALTLSDIDNLKLIADLRGTLLVYVTLNSERKAANRDGKRGG